MTNQPLTPDEIEKVGNYLADNPLPGPNLRHGLPPRYVDPGLEKMVSKLIDKTVDLDVAAVPSTVKIDDGRERAVAASAYLPRFKGYLPGHLVVYNRGDDELIAPDDKNWAVSLRVVSETLDMAYLAHGDYDLTFADAMALFIMRVQKQG